MGLLALTSTACVEIEGGAVEFNWSLRDFAGTNVDCERAGVDQIRLSWRSAASAAEGCQAPDSWAQFDCEVRHGVTGFVIDAGAQLLCLTPICPDGFAPDPATYSVPPPILRTIVDGEVVSLDSLLIVSQARELDEEAGVLVCNEVACSCQ